MSLSVEEAGTLQVADFDGDARDDLVFVGRYGPAASSVSFFSAAGELERNVSLPTAEFAAAADVTGDQLADIILGGSLMSAFQCSRARRFAPLMSALATVGDTAVLFAADIDCDGLRDFLLLDGHRLSQVLPSGTLVSLATLPISSKDLRDLQSEASSFTEATLHAVGRYKDASGNGCEMLALPGAKGGDIEVYGFKNERVDRLAVVAYDADSQPIRWLFTDMNADGRDDLVITSYESNWISYGVGNGTFHSDALALPPADLGQGDGKTVSLDPPGEILAANGSSSQPAFVFSNEGLLGGEYRGARIVDFTGDGLLDVAAVGQTRSVDLLRGHPSTRFSLLSLPTAGLPSIQDVADFDGDGLEDLLLSEAPAQDAPANTASVLFSPVSTDTTGPTALAEFAAVDQMVAGYLGDEMTPADGNADIGVLYTGADKSKNVGFLAGGSDRLLRSQLPSDTTGDNEFIASRVPIIGHFRDAGTVDLLVAKAVGLDGRPSNGMPTYNTRVDAFSINKNGTKQLGTTLLEHELVPELGVGAIDTDGDGLDELYLIGTEGLYQLRKSENGFEVTVVVAEPGIEQLVTLEGNADGKLDIAFSRGDELWLLTAKSDSNASKLHRFSAASLGCQGVPLAFAFLQADLDPELELALSCPFLSTGVADGDAGGAPQQPDAGNLKICDVDLTRNELSLSHVVPVQSTGDFVVGDFNGDGVDDIAGSFQVPTVLWGKPRP